MLTQACADASTICSVRIPALQTFAREHVFHPILASDPQCVSKVLTCVEQNIFVSSKTKQYNEREAENQEYLPFS